MKIDEYTLDRANGLISRGLSMEQVAKTLGVSRTLLYNRGFRSARGYTRSA